MRPEATGVCSLKLSNCIRPVCHGAKLLVYAEQEEALKQQLRCTQEVLEAAREEEEEAAAGKAALEQVSYMYATYLHIC